MATRRRPNPSAPPGTGALALAPTRTPTHTPTRTLARTARPAPALPPYVAHCLELLAPLGLPRANRMFGAHGLYLDELFVGIVSDELLYLKVDAVSQPRFEVAGSTPFQYTARGERRSLGFWRAPDEALETPAAMAPWAQLAVEAAVRSRARPPRGRGLTAPAPASPTASDAPESTTPRRPRRPRSPR